jgi:hypothetical protein
MSAFSFLKGVTVQEEITPAKKSGGVARKERNPAATLLAIRLFANGSVYPSQALVDKFNLEYKKATITKEGEKNNYSFSEGAGNGFDVIDSRHWGGYKAAGDMLFISPVVRTEPKVDLFKVVNYNEDGTPTSSVMDQGAATFGKEVLIPAVKELYGIELSEDKPFVDLIVTSELAGVNVTEAFKPKAGYYNFPKRIVRGSKKDSFSVERRENPVVYALVPQELLQENTSEGTKVDSEDEDMPQAASEVTQDISTTEVEKLPYKPELA